MDVGIIGLGQSGKTTVFNAVTRGKAQTGFGGGQEPNIAVVKVPDRRLDTLSAMYKPKKHTPAVGGDLLVDRRHVGRRILVDQW